MAKREWVGNYDLVYEEYLSYKDMWVPRITKLGKCISVDEACEKAMNFLIRENVTVNYDTMYVVDGWNECFYAVER